MLEEFRATESGVLSWKADEILPEPPVWNPAPPQNDLEAIVEHLKEKTRPYNSDGEYESYPMTRHDLVTTGLGAFTIELNTPLLWWRISVKESVLELCHELRSKAPTGPLSQLLQMLVILAQELGDEGVKKWAKLELGGYFNSNAAMTEEVVVPEYRTVVGLWHDRFGHPLLVDGPSLQFVNSYRLRNGVAELEELSRSDKPHTILDPAHAEIFRNELKVHVDRIVFGPQEVTGVLSNIRTRFIEALGSLQDALGESGAIETMDAGLEISRFHPVVVRHAAELFAGGHHRQAILDTYIALIQQVKALSGRYDLDGTSLMNTVFSVKGPKLSISTDADEQLGFMWLFAGAVMGIRNPKAHSVTPHPDKQTTLEWLAFASVLFRVLDNATRIQP